MKGNFAKMFQAKLYKMSEISIAKYSENIDEVDQIN